MAPIGEGSAAGLGSSCQGSSGWAVSSLRASEDRQRLTLRGPGSPYAKPLHFASPAADGSRIRVNPGASSPVPRSPRTSQAGSPRGSPRNSPRGGSPRGSLRSSPNGTSFSGVEVCLRGQPAGKVVESIRNGHAVTWPHVKGAAAAPTNATLDEDEKLYSDELTAAADRCLKAQGGSLQLARMALGRSATEVGGSRVTAMPEKEILASKSAMVHDVMQPSTTDEQTVITTAEVTLLADKATKGAETHAKHHHPCELPPSPEPLYLDNPWRKGISARSKEKGAFRLFPMNMITAHAHSKSSSPELRRLGRTGSAATNSSQATGTVIPRARRPSDPPFERMIPSSTVSMSSAGDLPAASDAVAAPQPALNAVSSGGYPSTAPVTAENIAAASKEAADSKAVNGTLQRSRAGALPIASTTTPAVAKKAPRKSQPSPSPPPAQESSETAAVPNASSGKGNAASARLYALRKCKEDLQKAQDGPNKDAKQPDKKAVSNRRISRGKPAA